MTDYESPRIVASYEASALVADAATCSVYSSDEALKDEIRPIARSLDSLRDVNSD
jgi:hypothetical protein